VLTSFNGGEAIVGIHGTNKPELIGEDVSSGCIRVRNDAIREMRELLPLGTPVSIEA
jgi:lipoprotein-anchoring transpeptidase ErfK/SrfK